MGLSLPDQSSLFRSSCSGTSVPGRAARDYGSSTRVDPKRGLGPRSLPTYRRLSRALYHMVPQIYNSQPFETSFKHDEAIYRRPQLKPSVYVLLRCAQSFLSILGLKFTSSQLSERTRSSLGMLFKLDWGNRQNKETMRTCDPFQFSCRTKW